MGTGFYHPNDNDPQTVEAQGAQSYVNLAKDWAIKMDGPVQGESYSSQWNATLSAQSAGESAASAGQAQQFKSLSAEYASNPEDAYITGTSQYSAMHWAIKSQGFASDAAQHSQSAAGSAQAAEDAVSAATNVSMPAVVADPATSRNLSASDASKYIRFTSAAPVSVIVPDDNTEDWVVGCEIHIRCAGAGGVTISPVSAVTVNTLNSPGGLTLSVAGATATLKKVGENEWDLFGLVGL
ncbi:hypothetical protein [Microbulbifer sp. SSSA005]|uniref:hypothetical protein n=1 Tax=Microbulbifer sp. SSSA005 TaxID=3243378 RepID=UPI00403A3DC2